jgi:hypothetical protein
MVFFSQQLQFLDGISIRPVTVISKFIPINYSFISLLLTGNNADLFDINPVCNGLLE